MGQFFTLKAVARYVATVAFSIFSYAVMAQSAPTTDACGHMLSAFQQRLYRHYLAGPNSLRQFVFSLHGVRQLDLYEADAWARNVQAQGCTADEPVASMSEDAAPASTAGSASRADMPVERTRAAVVAELRNAQAAGELSGVGELSDARVSSVVPANASVATTRTAVRQELALARSAHQLQFGER